MKIAQVAPFYYPRRGGVETVVKEYSERLVKRGHCVDVYTTDGGIKSPWVEDINGVRVQRSIRVPLPFLKPLSPAPLFPLGMLRADVDLIHVHANKYFSTDLGSLVAKLRGIPLVYSPHAGTFGQSFFGRVHNQTIGRLALSADVVTCVSRHERSLIEASGVKVKRFEIIPNGVNLDKYKSDVISPRPLQNNITLPGGKTVLYLGRVVEHKGLDTLIDAAPLILREVPEAIFVIAGPGEQSSKFKAQSSKLGDGITFLGEVSEEDKLGLLKQASVFVLPSRSEAFGITVIEAMAAGCPVVVSDIPALTEIVSDGQTGLVFPVDDERALAARVVRLFSDENLRKKISDSAQRKVEEKYDWQKIVDRLEEIYSGLVLPK